MATFAALGHFLLFFLTRFSAGDRSINGINRLDAHLGTGFAGGARFTSRTRGTRFALLAGFARLTLHALFGAHFATGFPFLARFPLLTRLTLFARATIAITALAAGCAFTLLAGLDIATAAVVIATATLTTAAGFIALVTVPVILASFALGGRFVGRRLHLGRSRIGGGTEQAGEGLGQLAKEADLFCNRSGSRNRSRGGGRNRLGSRGKPLQQRLFALDYLSLARLIDRLGNLGFELVAGRFRDLVLTDAGHFVVRGFQMLVRNDVDTHIIALFQIGDGGTLLVEQIGGHIDRHLGMNLLGVVLHGLFFDETKDGQGEGFVVTDDPLTLATGADMAAGLVEGGTQTLARHLQQTETGDTAQLDTGTILMHRFTQTVFHFALMANRGHVDEVDDNQATQVTQTQLTGNLVCCFQVGLQGGLFDIAALGGAGGVDIDGGQCFGRIDDDAAAGGQAHFALEGRFDLALDLEVVEQGDIALVQLHAIEKIGTDQLDM